MCEAVIVTRVTFRKLARPAALQKPPAEGGAVGQCAGEDLNSRAVQDACEVSGHATTQASGAEAANTLCWYHVDGQESSSIYSAPRSLGYW